MKKMESTELKNIYTQYFKDSMKNSKEYKKMFNDAVDFQKTFVDKLSKEDKEIFEIIIEKFIEAEDQILEDTFVNAVRYSYKVFQELK